VVAAVGDYAASQISNDSAVVGAHVSDALNTLNAQPSAYVLSTAAQAIASAALVDITNMSWPLAAGAKYQIALQGPLQSVAVGTVGFGAVYSGTASQFVLSGIGTASASGPSSIWTINTNVLGTAGTTNFTVSLASDRPFELFGTIVTISAGTFKLQAQNASGTLTLSAGVVGRVTRIG
jgi:hypothetical protein